MTIPTTSGDTPNSPEASIYSAYITEELRRYDEHLRDVRGLAAGTRKSRLRIIGWLLEGKFKRRQIVFARMRPDDVRQFLARRLAKQQSASYASHHAAALRSYLRYRATCGDQVGELTAVIANPVHWRLATLPRALSVEDADRLLDRCCRPARCQSAAMHSCVALDLGLRSGEIAHLNINDIDWQAGTLMLRGTKSQRQDVVPLPRKLARRLPTIFSTNGPSAPGRLRLVASGREITSWAIQKSSSARAIVLACQMQRPCLAPCLCLPSRRAWQLTQGSRRPAAPPLAEQHPDLRQARHAEVSGRRLALAGECSMSAHVSLQQRIDDYLAERQRLGFKLHSRSTLLAGFARYVADQQAPGAPYGRPYDRLGQT